MYIFSIKSLTYMLHRQNCISTCPRPVFLRTESYRSAATPPIETYHHSQKFTGLRPLNPQKNQKPIGVPPIISTGISLTIYNVAATNLLYLHCKMVRCTETSRHPLFYWACRGATWPSPPWRNSRTPQTLSMYTGKVSCTIPWEYPDIKYRF